MTPLFSRTLVVAAIVSSAAAGEANADTARWANFQSRIGTYTVSDAPSCWMWDAANRAEAQDAYWSIFVPNDAIPFGSTSNVANLVVGETSREWQEALLRVVNLNRRYIWGNSAVYASPVVGDAAAYWNDVPAGAFTTQQAVESAALVLARNSIIDHYPASNLPGYSAAAAAGAKNSNLGNNFGSEIGDVKPSECVNGFFVEGGANNFEQLLHRWWLMSPGATYGVATACYVDYDYTKSVDQYVVVLAPLPLSGYWDFYTPTPAYPDGILATWPARGAWVPYQWLEEVSAEEGLRMSAYFTNSPTSEGVTVTVSRNGTALPVAHVRNTNSGLSWDVSAGSFTTAPAQDQKYDVTISNIYNGRTFSYSFYVYDPATIQPVSVTPAAASINFSTQRAVTANGESLASVLAVSGSDPVRFAVRARSSSVAGITAPALNPRIALYQLTNSLNTSLGTTKAWKSETNWRMIQSYGLAPNDTESAAVVTLLPGVYTAVLTGTSDGQAAFEIQSIDSSSTATLASATAVQEARFDLSVAPVAGASYAWKKDGVTVSGAAQPSLTVASASAADAGLYSCDITANGTTTTATLRVKVTAATFTLQPFTPGASVDLAALADAGATLQWQRNGANLPGATSQVFTQSDLQPDKTGLYALTSTKAGATTIALPQIVGLNTSTKIVGTAREVLSNRFLPANGNTYDQELLEGPAVAVKADSAENQITRISFIDVDDDIVQVEFSGPGTLSLVVDGASTPALPARYNQNVLYVKGHPAIVITGATEQSNVSVFSVGKITAVDQSLFKSGVQYDGMADVAFIAISSTNGKFGGIFAGNAEFIGTKGFVGIYAPGVEINGPMNIGDISAGGTAKPLLVLGSAKAATRITGGDLLQSNSAPVETAGITRLQFVNGTDSHGTVIPAGQNRAVFMQGGTNVTSQVVGSP